MTEPRYSRLRLALAGPLMVVPGAILTRAWGVVLSFVTFYLAAFAIFGMVMPLLGAAVAAYLFVGLYIALAMGRSSISIM